MTRLSELSGSAYGKMRILSIAGVFAALFCLAGCSDNSVNQSFIPHEFDLGEKQFTIKLPTGANVQSSVDKTLVMMYLQPGARHSPRITLRLPFTGDAGVLSGKTISVGRSGKLHYGVSVSQNSGSGDPEAFLNGQLVMGPLKYVVSCAIQSEYVTVAQAAWCVDYLSTLALR